MDELWRDVRQAARSLAARPAFAFLAILTLALGIASNTAIFTVVNALLLRSLPYAEPERLVAIADVTHGQTSGVGMSNYLDWRRDNTVFEDMALTEFAGAVIGDQAGEEAERIVGADVTSSFFHVLGVTPLIGRAFEPKDEFKGSEVAVIVLGHSLWQRRYGGRADIVGKVIAFDGRPCTVVGVMPPGFWYVENGSSQFYVPQRWRGSGRGQHQYGAIARLKPGVTIDAAQAQMSAIARRIELEYPQARGWGVRVTALAADLMAPVRTPLAVLAAAVGLVLLIACANLAALLLVRTASRTRETAIRAALGASRTRLTSHVLAEAAILGTAGAVLGAWLAHTLVRAVASRIPARFELPVTLEMDGRVLAFALLLSLASAFGSSLLPLWRASRVDLVQALRLGGGRAGAGGAHGRVLRAAIGVEMALAAILLVAGALLVTSLLGMMRADLGFDPDNLLTMQVRHLDRGVTRKNAATFYGQLLERVQALPGVSAAAATWSLPLSGQWGGGGFTIEGRPAPEEWRQMSAQHCVVTPGYFRAMRMRLLSGRGLDERDTADAPRVVVINASLANRHWPGQSAVGARLRQGTEVSTIVGVVSDILYNGPTGVVPPALYYPLAQQPGTDLSLVVRATSDRGALVPAIRGTLKEMDRGSVLVQVRSMEDLLAERIGANRLVAALMGGFAGLALALAAVGLYGAIAQWVVQRRQELGIRLALGATRAQVLKLVLRQGLVLSTAGAAAGLVAAAAVTRAMAALLFGIGPRDPLVFAGAPLVIVGVALAACYVPARRAARVDPIEALKCE